MALAEGSGALRDCVGVCSSRYSCSSHLKAEFPLWTEASRATPCLCPCCPPCRDRTQGTSLRATAAPCPGAGFSGSLLCPFCLGAGLSSPGALAPAGPSPPGRSSALPLPALPGSGPPRAPVAAAVGSSLAFCSASSALVMQVALEATQITAGRNHRTALVGKDIIPCC